MINYELLERLCRANSVSGDEDSVRSIIIDEIKPYAGLKTLIVERDTGRPMQEFREVLKGII